MKTLIKINIVLLGIFILQNASTNCFNAVQRLTQGQSPAPAQSIFKGSPDAIALVSKYPNLNTVLKPAQTYPLTTITYDSSALDQSGKNVILNFSINNSSCWTGWQPISIPLEQVSQNGVWILFNMTQNTSTTTYAPFNYHTTKLIGRYCPPTYSGEYYTLVQKAAPNLTPGEAALTTFFTLGTYVAANTLAPTTGAYCQQTVYFSNNNVSYTIYQYNGQEITSTNYPQISVSYCNEPYMNGIMIKMGNQGQQWIQFNYTTAAQFAIFLRPENLN